MPPDQSARHLIVDDERELQSALCDTLGEQGFVTVGATNAAEGLERFVEVRTRIHPDALAALLRYRWPGNVRELANVLERGQILAEDYQITLDDLPEDVLRNRSDEDARAGLPIAQNAASAMGDATSATLNLKELEADALRRALEECHGNRSQAARSLGISRRSLYRLLERYHLIEDAPAAPE